MPKRLLFSVTIADCRVDTFRCGGNGGQNVNKVETGVRITHKASSAVGQSCDERHQGQNKRIAWRRMCTTDTFKAWHRRMTAELLTGRSIEDVVESMMDPKHLKLEVRTHEGWTKVPVNDPLTETT